MSTAERAGRFGLAVVLVATLFTLFVGFAHKSLCLMGDFDVRRYTVLCYSDIVPLYREEHLLERKVPYLEAPNEYPPATGLLMWSAALVSDREGSFFLTNAALLAALALLIAWLLHRAAGMRALYFALAPSLALYAFLNWDLLAVFFATAGTVAFTRRRDVGAGVLLGLGAAAKIYPALLLIPFAIHRLRQEERRAALRLTLSATVAWALVDLPFAVLAFDRWAHFFRFSSARPPTPGTLWYAACHALTGRADCGHGAAVNALSLILFVAVAALAWRWKSARSPGFPAWTFGLPLVAAVLLTAKVFSPQYSLWLLPWFALALPDLRLFILFELADVAVFATEFSHLATLSGESGAPLWLLALAVAARAVAIAAILVAWVRAEEPVSSPAAQERVNTSPASSS